MNDLINADTADQLTKIPDELEPFLTLLDEPVKLPICRACEAAILPKSLMDHFRKHHELPVELRKAVRSLVAALPSLDFNDISNNPDGSSPVAGLRVVDAFQCKHCPFIRRDVTDVRKHINTEHSLPASRNYDRIKAQSWFGGRRAIYWRVSATSADTVESPPKQSCTPASNQPFNYSVDYPVDYDVEVSLLPNCRWGLFGIEWGPRHQRD